VIRMCCDSRDAVGVDGLLSHATTIHLTWLVNRGSKQCSIRDQALLTGAKQPEISADRVLQKSFDQLHQLTLTVVGRRDASAP
jgi:hypothetical protein